MKYYGAHYKKGSPLTNKAFKKVQPRIRLKNMKKRDHFYKKPQKLLT